MSGVTGAWARLPPSLEALGTGLVVLSAAGKLLHANPAARRLLDGLGPVGSPVQAEQLGPGLARDLLDPGVRAAVTSRTHFLPQTGTWLHADVEVVDGQTVLLVREVTERHRERLTSHLLAVLQDQLASWTTTEDPLLVIARALQDVTDATAVDVVAASGHDDRPAPERQEPVPAGDQRLMVRLPVQSDALPPRVVALQYEPERLGDWPTILPRLQPALPALVETHNVHHDHSRVFQLTGDLLAVAEPSGRLVRVNPGFAVVLESSPRQLIGRSFQELVHPDDLPLAQAAFGQLDHGATMIPLRLRCRTTAGNERCTDWTLHRVPGELLVYLVGRDVTEQVQQQHYEHVQREALREYLLTPDLPGAVGRLLHATAERLGAASPRAAIYLLADDDHLRLLSAGGPSDAFPAGLPRSALEAVLGKADHTVQVQVLPADAATRLELPTPDGSTPLRWCGGWSTVTADRVVGAVLLGLADHMPPQGMVRSTVQTLLDLSAVIIQRARHQEVMAASESRFRSLALATNDAVWEWELDSDRVWRRWKDGTRLGYAGNDLQETLEAWSDRLHPADQERVLRSLRQAIDAGATTWAGHYRLRRADGSFAFVADHATITRDAAGKAVRLTGGLVDETERQQFQQRFLRAQRLDTVGALVGGIAHDLNNVLAPVLMAGELLGFGELDAAQTELVDTMAGGANRAAAMVSQLLNFARGIEGEPSAIDVQQVVSEVARLARKTFPWNISIERTHPGGQILVLGDRVQLEQAVLNLAVNARDAMPDGGTLTFAVERSIASVEAGESEVTVRLSVTDTGRGIDPEHLPRLFDPFFTTKRGEGGSGLGLPMVRAIVEAHGGRIHATSQPGEGSRFEHELPGLPHAVTVQDVSQPRRLPEGSGERILVVDDEQAVRAMVEESLRALGYQVQTAASGAEALDILQAAGPPLDLLLLDLSMPVIDGRTLLRQVQEGGANMPSVTMSGLYDEDYEPTSTALRKPFTVAELASAVRDALDGGGHRGYTAGEE